jgi:NAD(P)H-dependent FMN reductase
MQTMPRSLLVVWWSMTGGTRQLVDALVEGAMRGIRDADAHPVHVRALPADRATTEDVLAASGFVFATPENLGVVSGMLKDFFDRTYYPALERLNGRPYATMVCAGSDGEGAVRQLDRIATGWRLRRAAPSLVIRTGAQSPESILAPKRMRGEDLARAAELGEGFGAALALGVL